MENSIYNLDKGRWDKEAPMKVSETRLFNRHARPNVEMCRDETSHRYHFHFTFIQTLIDNIIKMDLQGIFNQLIFSLLDYWKKLVN